MKHYNQQKEKNLIDSIEGFICYIFWKGKKIYTSDGIGYWADFNSVHFFVFLGKSIICIKNQIVENKFNFILAYLKKIKHFFYWGKSLLGNFISTKQFSWDINWLLFSYFQDSKHIADWIGKNFLKPFVHKMTPWNVILQMFLYKYPLFVQSFI